MDQLSKAEKDFTRMANSPPPPGMEEKVEEVNQRFKRVVKQTEDRYGGTCEGVGWILGVWSEISTGLDGSTVE